MRRCRPQTGPPPSIRQRLPRRLTPPPRLRRSKRDEEEGEGNKTGISATLPLLLCFASLPLSTSKQPVYQARRYNPLPPPVVSLFQCNAKRTPPLMLDVGDERKDPPTERRDVPWKLTSPATIDDPDSFRSLHALTKTGQPQAKGASVDERFTMATSRALLLGGKTQAIALRTLGWTA